MMIGTIEAARLLKICAQRVRQLLYGACNCGATIFDRSVLNMSKIPPRRHKGTDMLQEHHGV